MLFGYIQPTTLTLIGFWFIEFAPYEFEWARLQPEHERPDWSVTLHRELLKCVVAFIESLQASRYSVDIQVVDSDRCRIFWCGWTLTS